MTAVVEFRRPTVCLSPHGAEALLADQPEPRWSEAVTDSGLRAVAARFSDEDRVRLIDAVVGFCLVTGVSPRRCTIDGADIGLVFGPVNTTGGDQW